MSFGREWSIMFFFKFFFNFELWFIHWCKIKSQGNFATSRRYDSINLVDIVLRLGWKLPILVLQPIDNNGELSNLILHAFLARQCHLQKLQHILLELHCALCQTPPYLPRVLLNFSSELVLYSTNSCTSIASFLAGFSRSSFQQWALWVAR